MHRPIVLMMVAFALVACSGQGAPATLETSTSVAVTSAVTTGVADTSVDLSGIKKYLQTRGREELKAGSDVLKANADLYYAAVKTAGFDYARAWGDGKTLRPLIMTMRTAFNQAHSGYESIEGIVAGVPSLRQFDTILDAGSPGAPGADNVADYTLTLPDGAQLRQPGNFFHSLLEPMIYATNKDLMKLHDVDVNGDGQNSYGDALPDANLLMGVVDGFVLYVDQALAAIDAWQPTPEDAFTALVTMTPTMDEYFSNWKESRYVSGSASTEMRFVAHSRLVDVTQILVSIRTIYSGVRPLVDGKNPAAASQIDKNYADLMSFVQSLLDKENSGSTYTPDQAEVLGNQAQDQAQAITGQVTQAAAQLGITLEAN